MSNKASIDMDNVSLKSDIYPKWWGQKKTNKLSLLKNINYNRESSYDSKEQNFRNSNLNQSNNDQSRNDNEYGLDSQIMDKSITKIIANKKAEKVLIDKKFYKKKLVKESSSNLEEIGVIQNFDMSKNNKNYLIKSKKVKKDSNLIQKYSSKNKKIQENFIINKTPENKSVERNRRTDSVNSIKKFNHDRVFILIIFRFNQESKIILRTTKKNLIYLNKITSALMKILFQMTVFIIIVMRKKMTVIKVEQTNSKMKM